MRPSSEAVVIPDESATAMTEENTMQANPQVLREMERKAAETPRIMPKASETRLGFAETFESEASSGSGMKASGSRPEENVRCNRRDEDCQRSSRTCEEKRWADDVLCNEYGDPASHLLVMSLEAVQVVENIEAEAQGNRGGVNAERHPVDGTRGTPLAETQFPDGIDVELEDEQEDQLMGEDARTETPRARHWRAAERDHIQSTLDEKEVCRSVQQHF